ncbi:anaphase-promoting complex subunit 5-like [Arachis hypogaea]|uniref:anaphase-promoting complex subunit 5-like n=1 Tax=Arachis hypogaea TaxID=3818 RepID=UPI0011056F60|nr:anaphase-promoting complex subunit 5-like [Arachis hypogaea]
MKKEEGNPEKGVDRAAAIEMCMGTRSLTDIDVPGDSASKLSENVRVASPYGDPSSNMLRDDDPSGAIFLRTNWQLQGYLQEQDDIIEKNGVPVSLNGFEIVLRQLQKLAPELHPVHFLSYLNFNLAELDLSFLSQEGEKGRCCGTLPLLHVLQVQSAS